MARAKRGAATCPRIEGLQVRARPTALDGRRWGLLQPGVPQARRWASPSGPPRGRDRGCDGETAEAQGDEGRAVAPDRGEQQGRPGPEEGARGNRTVRPEPFPDRRAIPFPHDCVIHPEKRSRASRTPEATEALNAHDSSGNSLVLTPCRRESLNRGKHSQCTFRDQGRTIRGEKGPPGTSTSPLPRRRPTGPGCPVNETPGRWFLLRCYRKPGLPDDPLRSSLARFGPDPARRRVMGDELDVNKISEACPPPSGAGANHPRRCRRAGRAPARPRWCGYRRARQTPAPRAWWRRCGWRR